jgi:hypothetical protein
MKEYEIWETDHGQYVSSWNDLWDAVQECDRLNNTLNRGFVVRRNNPDGTISQLRR